jgi:hypothetical protein
MEYLQCRPASTVASRNMSEVGNNETMCISVLALYAYTLAAGAVGVKNGFCVDAHIDLVVLCFYEAFREGLLLVYIGDETICVLV